MNFCGHILGTIKSPLKLCPHTYAQAGKPKEKLLPDRGWLNPTVCAGYRDDKVWRMCDRLKLNAQYSSIDEKIDNKEEAVAHAI
ncbi:hypothetical protein WN53_26270 [Serratia fonticola]|uniref:hypothetical protein n=1 Tax=Serratia fonticola TaxID=47917 RepID=UPI000463E968|nr:hypothetical protein [Serratia fonticola]AKG72344.1 hypothetical protein WN53_26270 [Serratia fonticola]CAI2031223.1 Uncharacterised protein [Serratia fonticola]